MATHGKLSEEGHRILSGGNRAVSGSPWGAGSGFVADPDGRHPSDHAGGGKRRGPAKSLAEFRRLAGAMISGPDAYAAGKGAPTR